MKNHIRGRVILTLFFLLFLTGHAGATQPVILKSIGDRVITTNSPAVSINLSQYIKADPVTNFVRVTTSLLGTNGHALGFTLKLFPANAPKTVANFLSYVNDGAYENMLIHRSVPGFVIQTGGYGYDGSSIATWTNIVPSEASNGLSNIRGSVAMALVGSDSNASNSASDQWFINLNNNASILDKTNINIIQIQDQQGNYTYRDTNGQLLKSQYDQYYIQTNQPYLTPLYTNNPPFTVFAQVIGTGMTTVDAVSALPRYNFGAPFDKVPVKTTNISSFDDLVHISRVATIPYFTLSSDRNAYAPRIANSTLYIDYTGGTNPPSHPVTIWLAATDTNGLMTNTSLQVWHLTNQSRSINFPTNSNQYYSPNGFNMAFYPYSSDGTPLPSKNITWTGPVVFTGYTNGFNHFAFTNVGTVSFTYVQPGNIFYKPVTNTSQFIVTAAPQTITFLKIPNQTYSTNPFLLNNPPFSSSGIPVNISIKQGSPMTVISNKFFMTGVGNVTLVATNSTNVSVYQQATPVTNTFTITQAQQTISFPSIPNKGLPIAPFVLGGTASSGLPVTYTLASNSPATLTNGSTLRITAPGIVTIVASQAGTNTYLPAVPVTNTFRAATNQTISAFTPITNRTYATNAPSISINPAPVATSGLPVTISVKSGPATLGSNNALSITGAGTVIVAANQAGSSNYFPAPEVTNSFVVARAPQTITSFTGIPAPLSNGMTFTVTIPVTTSGTATTLRVSGAGNLLPPNTVRLTNSGILTITATNTGNLNYLPISLTTNITVLKSSQ